MIKPILAFIVFAFCVQMFSSNAIANFNTTKLVLTNNCCECTGMYQIAIYMRVEDTKLGRLSDNFLNISLT